MEDLIEKAMNHHNVIARPSLQEILKLMRYKTVCDGTNLAKVVMELNTAIAFILIFGALVFFHELGHLYFAKRAGILCREFAIGFGPKIFSFEKNETVYTIRLLPLGGYVRMAGEDADTVELKPGKKVGLVLNEKTKL